MLFGDFDGSKYDRSNKNRMMAVLSSIASSMRVDRGERYLF